MVKICFLITGLGVGGAEQHLLKLIPKLRFNHCVVSLTNENTLGKKLKKYTTIYYLGLTKWNLPFVVYRFKQVLKKERPDVLDTYLIHANLFGRIFGKVFGCSIILNSIRNNYAHWPHFLFLDKITKSFVTHYHINSPALITYLKKIGVKQYSIIPNAVDVTTLPSTINNDFSLRSLLQIPDSKKILVCVARLEKQKNHKVLFDALSMLPSSYVLVIVGDGSLRHALEQYAVSLGIAHRVFFLGKRNDALEIVKQSDIFVLPSLTEGMSNALLEAMALAKPCVVSNIPENTVLIKHKRNGLVFDPIDAKDLVKQILNSKTLFGIAAKAYVLKTHQLKKIVGQYECMVHHFALSISSPR
ncbi:MAG: glycosyltransferase [Candidatus Woesearchaeota archaeon]